MKHIMSIIFLSLGLLFSNQIHSQEKTLSQKTTSSSVEEENAHYIEKLELDRDKALTFEAINDRYEENVKALKIKSKNKKSIKKLKALEKERDKEIKILLSEEQFKNYIELRREKRNSLKTLIRKSNGQ